MAKSKKSILKWIIPAVVAVVAIVLLVVLFASGGSDSSDSFYHEMNFNNVAHFAYDDDRLYFISEYNDNAETTSLFSTDHNGINKKMVCDNENIIRIRVVDGKIYYVESVDEEYKIGVMDTDGSNNRIIVTVDGFVDKFAVQGDNLYYLTDSQLFVCDLDGKDSQVLLEGASTFVLGKNVLYYVQEDVIAAFDLKKEASDEICKAPGATDLALDNNILYFACDSGLSSVDVKGDGAVKRIINDSDLDAYVFYGDYIYYNCEFDTDEIAELATYLADDSDDEWTYRLLFIGAGRLYQANRDGTDARKVENTDDTIVFTLFTSPSDLYYKLSAFSDDVEVVEFE